MELERWSATIKSSAMIYDSYNCLREVENLNEIDALKALET